MSDVIILPEGLHSALGPSSSERWLNCGGGTGNGSTEYAAEGTVMHWLSEQIRHGKPWSELKGRTIQSGEFQFKVGKMMMQAVDTFVESVQCLPGVPIVEEMVHYDDIVPGGFGTLDDARLHLDAGIVTDFKGGKGVAVSAKGNSQLWLYDLGLFFKYDWLYKFRKFVNRISQPRRGVAAEVECEEVSVGHLLQWGYDVVRPRAEALLSGRLKDDLKAGPWCKFCGKKTDCSVRAAYQTAQATGTWRRDASEELITNE
jgi:Protein of unknown function (DUF2800)